MISVCMATYNGEKYVKDQVLSILNQLGENDEVIISDDHSSDRTLEIIRDIADKRIKVFSHDKCHHNFVVDYVASNFENALSKSQGDIIFLSDQDDVWMPNKVSEMIPHLKNNDLVISGYYETDGSLNHSGAPFYSTPGFWRNTFHNTNSGCCMAFKRYILERVLPFPLNGIGHDYWIGVIALHYYNVKYLNMPLMYYRRHGETVTPSGGKSTNQKLMKIKYRINAIVEYIKRVYL